jgi:hypothetical protein
VERSGLALLQCCLSDRLRGLTSNVTQDSRLLIGVEISRIRGKNGDSSVVTFSKNTIRNPDDGLQAS